LRALCGCTRESKTQSKQHTSTSSAIISHRCASTVCSARVPGSGHANNLSPKRRLRRTQPDTHLSVLSKLCQVGLCLLHILLSSFETTAST
jgi:hypothetical protein